MSRVKKLSLLAAFAVIVACCVPMLTGCFKLPEHTDFKIHYTPNLEFSVGEEYYDAQLKGYATNLEGVEEDVTEQMEVDSSEYNKDVPGTYKIYCTFEGVTLSYTVTVVE